MDVTVQAAIAAIPWWRGRVSEMTLLWGGLTNPNHLVRVDDADAAGDATADDDEPRLLHGAQ